MLPRLAYHDYEGIALNLDERERLVEDLGDKTLMLLRNHGTLSVGETAAGCWAGMFYLERACKQQVMALSLRPLQGAPCPPGGRSRPCEIKRPSRGPGMEATGKLAWGGCLRQLERESPGSDS